MSNFKVYVMTCDKYLATLEPFAYFFNKYYSPDQEVIVCGFTPPSFPLPPNFSFWSIGREEDYPVEKWSDQLLFLLDRITDDIFMLLFEDYFICEPANVDMVERLVDFSSHLSNLIKLDLATDRLYAKDATDWGVWDDIEFVKSDPNSAYHMSLYVGLWRRDHLLNVIVPGETPWDIEIQGTNRLASFGDNLLVLGTKQCPVRIHLFHRSGDPTVKLTTGIRQEDIDVMKQKGWL